MISQKHRFHGQRSVQNILRKGRIYEVPLFRARYRFSKLAYYRLAVVVSKKIDKKAVARNRLRRRLFHICKDELSLMPQALDLVIIVLQKDLLNLSHSQLQCQLKACFKHLQNLPKS